LVVAWDNAGKYVLGKDVKGYPVVMKPVILSNRGAEGDGADLPDSLASCDPRLLRLLARNVSHQLADQDLASQVFLNLVFRGGYVCEHYSTCRHPSELYEEGVDVEVQSFQVEYDGSMTCDQDTLEQSPEKVEALRHSFEEAVAITYESYY
jgi:hypothetical protein